MNNLWEGVLLKYQNKQDYIIINFNLNKLFYVHIEIGENWLLLKCFIKEEKIKNLNKKTIYI